MDIDSTEQKNYIMRELQSFDVVMLSTLSDSGGIDSRPMAVAKIEGDTIYFVTSTDSGKSVSVETRGTAAIAAQSRSHYIHLSGLAEMRNDAALLESVWNSSYDVWFPDGPADPKVTLLIFTATEGQLWEKGILHSAKYLWAVTKATITGDKPDLERSHSAFSSLDR